MTTERAMDLGDNQTNPQKAKSLGQMMREAELARIEAARIAAENRARQEAIAEQQRRKKVSDWYEDQKQRVANLILHGQEVKPIKVPRYMDIDDYSRSHGEEDARHPNNRDYDLYQSFIAWMGDNDLKAEFIYAHDGMGMESWMELKVSPL